MPPQDEHPIKINKKLKIKSQIFFELRSQYFLMQTKVIVDDIHKFKKK